MSLLNNAAKLCQLLSARRKGKGAAYSFACHRHNPDANGVPVDIGPIRTWGSRGLVENSVLANELAADFLWKQCFPALQGTKDFSQSEREELKAYLAHWATALNTSFFPGIAAIAGGIKGRPEELLICRKLARSLHKSRHAGLPVHYTWQSPAIPISARLSGDIPTSLCIAKSRAFSAVSPWLLWSAVCPGWPSNAPIGNAWLRISRGPVSTRKSWSLWLADRGLNSPA